MTGKLSIVATPIGNLEDITLRALRVLKEADVIYCEDTRVTKKLLSRYDIHTPLRRLDANVEAQKAEEVIGRLAKGEHVAHVTDAGTPGISDPGSRLVSIVRNAFSEFTSQTYNIEAIPGASALTTALSISGLKADRFMFLGFLPHKKGRESLLAEIAVGDEASIFYESPHRIVKTLAVLARLMPDRRVGIGRELTKLHEEMLVGTPEELLPHFDDPQKMRGEFVVVVEAV